MPTSTHIIDNRSSGSLLASNNAKWRGITDTVMGGVSSCEIEPKVIARKPCLHMRGNVSLENNGGFVQASLDLAVTGFLDASAYQGIEIEVRGDNQTYNVHLRTADTNVVWQSYRASFFATPYWQKIYLPFDSFLPHRTDTELDVRQLKRLGIVAIGKEMPVNLYFAKVLMR